MKRYNKREKTANLLFKVVEYGLIAFGINALLPNSPISLERAILGFSILIIVFIIALVITPEKEV